MRSLRRWGSLGIAALLLLLLLPAMAPGQSPLLPVQAAGPPGTPAVPGFPPLRTPPVAGPPPGTPAVPDSDPAASQAQISEFALPHPDSQPAEITVGPDGNLWFTEDLGNRIGRITPEGVITEFSLPITGSLPVGITAGWGRDLWFTELGGSRIGRITLEGTITEFPLPTPGSYPWGITTDSYGRLWFTEWQGNRIGRITEGGEITEFALPTPASQPVGITVDADDYLWFTESGHHAIGLMTPQGSIVEFSLPFDFNQPWGITAGPDQDFWFTDLLGGVGRLTWRNGFSITEFGIPAPYGQAQEITAAPDGNFWFTVYGSEVSQIGRITRSGIITRFALPKAVSAPYGITVGPDGNVWFTEARGNSIGRLSGFGPPPIATPPGCTVTFSDVPVESWAYGYIRYLVCNGLASGYSDGTFRPDAAVTRAQLAKMAVLAAGAPLNLPPGAPHFSDVPPAHPFYTYVEAARAAGLISGYSDGTFQPSAPVTRAQLAKIIVGATGFPLVSPATPTFGDVPADNWAYSYVETAVAHGIAGGYTCGGTGEPCPGRYYRPGAQSTRAQVAKLLYQAFAVPARK